MTISTCWRRVLLSGRVVKAALERMAVKPLFLRKSVGLGARTLCFHYTKGVRHVEVADRATAFAIVTLPASAQTTAPPAGGQVTAPSGQNSGAGIPGKPGSKSGPAVKPSGETREIAAFTLNRKTGLIGIVSLAE
jgi:hypothetical protein